MAKMPFQMTSEKTDQDDLPWLNVYIKNVSANYPFGTQDYPVSRIYVSPKGLLVLTECFKLFLFKNSKLSKQLLEAVKAWSKGTKPLGYLYVMPTNRKGAMEFGIETDLLPKNWEEEESENYLGEMRLVYTQCFNKDEALKAGKTPIRHPDNPFLTPTTPSPLVGYSDDSPHPTGEKPPRKASRSL